MGAEFWISMAGMLAVVLAFQGRMWLLLSRAKRADAIARKRWDLRNKLEFAVSVSRNGGYWMRRGETRRSYRVSPGGPVFEVCKGVHRWQSA